MHKIIITSTSFTGEVYVLYGPERQLLTIDFKHAEISDNNKHFIKSKCPCLLDKDFPQCFTGAPLTFTREGQTIEFDQFWDAYAYKVNRLRAYKEWNKLKPPDKMKAFYGIVKYDKHLKENTWKNKADPENYIKKKYWENEY